MSRIDTLHTVETPEGVDFHIRPAGPIARIQAATVDVVLRTLIFIFASIALGFLGTIGQGLMLITFFVIYWGYSIYFEMYFDGMTPGKRMLDLQVRNADGTPVSWRGSLLRNLLRVADFLPFGYVTGIVSILMTGRFQRLGDLAGDTVVCYRQEDELPGMGDLPEVEAIESPDQLTLDEQRAIVRFAARSKNWSVRRNRELARLVEPLTETSDPDEGIRHLQGVANAILHGS